MSAPQQPEAAPVQTPPTEAEQPAEAASSQPDPTNTNASTESSPQKPQQQAPSTAASAASLLNPFRMTNWILEALLVKESKSSPQHSNRPLVGVTGAGGFIASHVVKVLADNGYRVRGTVRDASDDSKVGHLKKLFPNMELFEADLLKEGSFDKVFEGCKFVIHCASPFQLVVEDPQRDLIDPALEGTKNVVNAALKSSTVKRIVVTSSVAAVINESPPEDHSKKFTEADWNSDSTLERGPYRLSKRLAEQAAWSMVEEFNKTSERKVDLVVLNPAAVFGPPLSARVDATSVSIIKGFLEGKFKETGCRPVCVGCVDVRDVAKAHVVALEIPQAAGKRFLLTSETGYSHLEIARLLNGDFRAWPLPSKEESPITYRPLFDVSEAKNVLHVQFSDIKKAVVDQAKEMVKLGIVKKP